MSIAGYLRVPKFMARNLGTCRRLRLPVWPVVCLVRSIAAPSIKCVIQRHAHVELFEIIREHPRQTERRCQQARCFGCKVGPGGIGTPDYGCEPGKRLGSQAKLFDHYVKCEASPLVAPEHILDIESCAIEPVRHGFHLGRGHEKENRLRIDEAADKPWAGYPVIFGRARVTQIVRPFWSRAGRCDTGTRGKPAAAQASNPPSRVSAGMTL